MMPGFVELDAATFHIEVWPRIKKQADAVESNWEEAKAGARPIVIKWGWKEESTKANVVVAITTSDEKGDTHWIAADFARQVGIKPSKGSQ